MPFYASAEQIMRDRSEYARKGISRGRSVVVLTYADGVLFVAENPSSTLHKVSEIYDRIGFAAVGRYSEFENLRTAGIKHADLRGYTYDRRDVTARALANAYAGTLGAIFTEQVKPYEVEVCVAEVGPTPAGDQLYRLTYDGSVGDEPNFVVMGGQADTISGELKTTYIDGADLKEAIGVAVRALSTGSSNTDGDTLLEIKLLEVAVLDRTRPSRAFRRIQGAALKALLPTAELPTAEPRESTSKPIEDVAPPEDVL
jgi:proteasome alpha subunit